MISKIASYDWMELERELNENGYAVLEKLLDGEMCQRLVSSYEDEANFRATIQMQRYNFGSGEYKYFAYPLPDLISALRSGLYPHLARIANGWSQALKTDVKFPDDHDAYLKQCHENGQTRPTLLLLRYKAGDYNCLHQDLYGEAVFPLQVAVLLSAPQADYKGGEFVVTEQRPRMQTRVEVVPLKKGMR